MLRKLINIGLAFLFLASVTCAGALAWLVVFAPGDQIKQGNIEKLLAVESPVYFSDGERKLGVFFEKAHRQYTPFSQIPEKFVQAIVAAEDNNFFSHHGVDLKGLSRAFWANLKAGRVVQGGSTITQQTAKNLFKRQSRSVVEKVKEMLFALRLEYHYPKEKILEFYINQFYVSGNGRGLGVAARYYFDRPVEELTLLECAFIAGSVKKPNAYNPFIKKDEEAVRTARQKAKVRTGYVLLRLKSLGVINKTEYDDLRSQEIPFQQGETYFSISTVMDLVKEAMAEPAVQDAFLRHGIENIATSGISVYTTVEKDMQDAALVGLRKELSRLDTRLDGYESEEVQKTLAKLKFGNRRNLKVGGFLIGRITSIETGSHPTVHVTFEKHDPTGPARGVIAKKGLNNLLVPLVRYERNRWSEPRASDMGMLLSRLQVGELVYVGVRSVKEDGGYWLDLEKYPNLQGAVLAFKEGRVKAMVGGAENRFFNRAAYGRRPMGSVIKPLVYCAAMQLGWSSVDLLHNERNVFVYQNKPYFPRPDHHSPNALVSMNWAGVKSENLATIWLLYHLCDHLPAGNFKEVVNELGLGRLPNESYGRFKERIRDKYGILVNKQSLLAAAYQQAVVEMEPDLIFSGKLDEFEVLRTSHYGVGFDRYLADNEAGLAENLTDEEKSRKMGKEARIREAILGKNFLRLQEMSNELATMQQQIVHVPPPLITRLYRFGQNGRVAYFSFSPPGQEWRPISAQEAANLADFAGQTFWDDIYLDGHISNSTVALLASTLEREYKKLSELPPYSDEVLHNVPDYRVMVSLHYIIGLCRELGITSKLDPVLSFPLGSNVISLLEVVKAYEGMVGTGVYVPRDQAESNVSSIIIDRIEDSQGRIIFQPTLKKLQAVDPRAKVMVGDILRNVVKFGTGRLSDQKVRLHSDSPERERQLAELNLRVPVMGKTGTANRFTNASFAGVVPGLSQDGQSFSVDEGYVVAAYVGYDDNKPMVRGSSRIGGSSGALPVWNRLANDILQQKQFADTLDLVDFSFSNLSQVPLRFPNLGQIEIEVNPARGGRVQIGAGPRKRHVSSHDEKEEKTWFLAGRRKQATILAFGEVTAEGTVKPDRQFKPYWRVMKKVNEQRHSIESGN